MSITEELPDDDYDYGDDDDDDDNVLRHRNK